MKIAIDASFYGLEHSGLGRYTMNLVKELQNIDKTNTYYIILRKKYYDKLKFRAKWNRVLFDVPHYSIREQFLLPRLLKEVKPDLFHALSVNFPVIYSGKSVMTLHDLTQMSFTKKATTLPAPIYLFKHLGLRFVVNSAVSKVSRIIVPSKSVGRDLMDIHDLPKNKLTAIYEGVTKMNDPNPDDVPQEFKFKEKYFFYIGNAYPHKNLKRLIEAVKSLNEKRSERVLLVIGGSRDIFIKRMNKIVIQDNIEQYIRTVGYIPEKYMKYVYENAVGFVYPSLSEGFGLQGLEAMHAGTLLLASNIPVFKEVYKDNAIYFNPYDFSKITDSMNDALEMSEKQRNNRIKSAKAYTEKFSWKKMARKTLKVYNEI